MFRATYLVIYSCIKKHKDAIQILYDRFLLWVKKDGQCALLISEAYRVNNYKDYALNRPDNSFNCGFDNYPFLNKLDAFLENICGEEWFKRLME